MSEFDPKEEAAVLHAEVTQMVKAELTTPQPPDLEEIRRKVEAGLKGVALCYPYVPTACTRILDGITLLLSDIPALLAEIERLQRAAQRIVAADNLRIAELEQECASLRQRAEEAERHSTDHYRRYTTASDALRETRAERDSAREALEELLWMHPHSGLCGAASNDDLHPKSCVCHGCVKFARAILARLDSREKQNPNP